MEEDESYESGYAQQMNKIDNGNKQHRNTRNCFNGDAALGWWKKFAVTWEG